MNLPSADDPEPVSAAAEQHQPTRPAATRKMLDEIFGEVLPTITSDERDEQHGRGSGDAERDRWYRDNRPPHHD